MMIKLTSSQFEILSLGTEDYFGLWHILWILMELFPTRNQKELERLAQENIRGLAGVGLIDLVYFDYRREKQKVVPVGEFDSVLSNSAYLYPPITKVSNEIWFTATEMGAQTYFSKKYEIVNT